MSIIPQQSCLKIHIIVWSFRFPPNSVQLGNCSSIIFAVRPGYLEEGNRRPRTQQVQLMARESYCMKVYVLNTETQPPSPTWLLEPWQPGLSPPDRRLEVPLWAIPLAQEERLKHRTLHFLKKQSDNPMMKSTINKPHSQIRASNWLYLFFSFVWFNF